MRGTDGDGEKACHATSEGKGATCMTRTVPEDRAGVEHLVGGALESLLVDCEAVRLERLLQLHSGEGEGEGEGEGGGGGEGEGVGKGGGELVGVMG